MRPPGNRKYTGQRVIIPRRSWSRIPRSPHTKRRSRVKRPSRGYKTR